MKNEEKQQKVMTRMGYAMKLSKYIKGYWVYLGIAILCNLIFKLLPLCISFCTSLMVSQVVLGEVSMIPVLFLTIAILVVLDALFSYFDILVSHDMTYRILTKLRDMSYDKISELAPSVMVGKRSGDFVSTIIDDVELLEWFYAHVIAQVVVAIAIPVAMLVVLCHFSIWLPIVIVPFIILLLLVPRYVAGKSNEQGIAVRTYAGRLNAEIIDGVQGLKDILSFGWQKKYFERFSQAEKEYRDASLDYEGRSARDMSIMNLIVELAGLAADVATVILVKNGSLDVTYMLPIFLMSTGIFAPIMEALTMSNNYGLIFGAAKRVVKLLEMKAEVKDCGVLKAEAAQEDKEMLRFEQVSFRYPSKEKEIENPNILRDVSFSLRQGETVALVGASGSGKTTISRLLLRFWDIDEGNIKIGKHNIKEFKLSELQKLVTVVPQESYLFAMSIEENLRLARQTATMAELKEACGQAQADVFIQEFEEGYSTVLGERGLRLSGGEKKRIAIAQAILKDAPILVLDESSANLDAENEKQINMAIQKLKQGKATLMIAHRLSTIKSADRIIFLKEGKIDAQGTYQELLTKNEEFRRLIGEAG